METRSGGATGLHGLPGVDSQMTPFVYSEHQVESRYALGVQYTDAVRLPRRAKASSHAGDHTAE